MEEGGWCPRNHEAWPCSAHSGKAIIPLNLLQVCYCGPSWLPLRAHPQLSPHVVTSKVSCGPVPALRLCHRTVCLPPDPDPVQPSTCHQTLGQELGLKRQAPGASAFHKGKLKPREGTWLPFECPWWAEDQCPHIPPPTQFSVQSHSSEDTENGSLGCHLPARITALMVVESQS